MLSVFRCFPCLQLSLVLLLLFLGTAAASVRDAGGMKALIEQGKLDMLVTEQDLSIRDYVVPLFTDDAEYRIIHLHGDYLGQVG